MGSRTKYDLIIIIILTAAILSACQQQKTTVEKIYSVLENVAAVEKGFEDQQKPITDLEKKEKSVYDQIIGLGMKQYDEILKLSNEALAMADQRKEYMDKETASIKKSEDEFNKMALLKDEIGNKDLKRSADELYDLMMKRYKAHEVLYKAYVNSIESDKQLYEMFKDKKVSIDKLEAQVNTVNADYKEIYSANDQFNKWTTQYNTKKLEFYKKSGLKK